LIYGMGEDGFEIYAVSNYGVKFKPGESAEFRDGFFQSYPALVDYHTAYKAYAKNHGKVYSPLGRVRHLPMINSSNRQVRSKEERRAINSPVQSTLSDLMVWSIAEEHKQGLSMVAPCFGACHDAGYNYVPEDRVAELVPRHVQIMENLPFEKVQWNPQLKFVADAKVGPNMADLVPF
jgi:DNA polymerase I-like protein with 3'-5' exonuclease and polymerase domains